ncbi:hypothetical protein Ddc_13190 [Ditylenchus destructor]|nr:hypothetical protein Ddc_13190 [Ditylenchus destructor]
MSNSKHLPPFTFEVLCYLNRDQLERFSIVCRRLQNFIKRYFRLTPYRIFNRLFVRGGSYALVHDYVRWHPDREDYNVQQFLGGGFNLKILGQKCDIVDKYYSFAEMCPYLGPTVRIEETTIEVPEEYIYNPEHIVEMESIAHLWRNGNICIWNYENDASRIGADDFQPIFNSPTILLCQRLYMWNVHLSFKDYKVLYAVKVIEIHYGYEDIDLWQQFLDQPGVKPVVVFHDLRDEYINNLLDRLSKAFSSAVLPNAFKIIFVQYGESLTEFRETNKLSGEILEFKKGFPVEYQEEYSNYHKYTLERYIV